MGDVHQTPRSWSCGGASPGGCSRTTTRRSANTLSFSGEIDFSRGPSLVPLSTVSVKQGAVRLEIGRLTALWGRLTASWDFQWTPGGAGRLNRSSPSCLNRSAQRIDFYHGLLALLASVGQKTPSGGWELPGNPPRSWA